jgi:hypothetical protein
MSTQPAGATAPTPSRPGQPASLLGSDGVTVEMRLQILASEHSSLVAARALAWNEAFARVGMYLSLLSGAIVALALVGQGSGFGQPFFVFGVVILPVVLFVGVATFLRTGSSNYHDAQCIIGMNRIRAGYLQLAPDLAPFFVMGVTDDPPGVTHTMSFEPGLSQLAHVLAATPAVVIVVDSVLAAAILAFALVLAGLAPAPVMGVAVLTFVASFAIHTWYARGRIRHLQAATQVRFPGPVPTA